MKKIAALLLALCMLLSLAACAKDNQTAPEPAAADAPADSGDTPAPANSGDTPAPADPGDAPASDASGDSGENKPYQLTFVCPIVGLEYWDMCSDGIRAADAEFGTETQIVGPSDPATFVAEIPNYMEAAIATKPDGIMAYSGVDYMPPLIEKAAKEGIAFIAIDSDAPDSERLAYVGTDPYNAGYASGEAMIEATGGSAKVGVLCSGLSSEKEMAEVDAFKEAVAGHDIEIIAMEETNADLATGVTKMQAMVQTYPEMNAVLGTSAYDVQAAAKIKEEMGLDDMVLVGYDDQEETLNYIREGVIDAIIVQNPYNMGYMGVKILKDYLDGVPLEQEVYDTGTITVTAENVDNYRD